MTHAANLKDGTPDKRAKDPSRSGDEKNASQHDIQILCQWPAIAQHLYTECGRRGRTPLADVPAALGNIVPPNYCVIENGHCEVDAYEHSPKFKRPMLARSTAA